MVWDAREMNETAAIDCDVDAGVIDEHDRTWVRQRKRRSHLRNDHEDNPASASASASASAKQVTSTPESVLGSQYALRTPPLPLSGAGDTPPPVHVQGSGVGVSGVVELEVPVSLAPLQVGRSLSGRSFHSSLSLSDNDSSCFESPVATLRNPSVVEDFIQYKPPTLTKQRRVYSVIPPASLAEKEKEEEKEDERDLSKEFHLRRGGEDEGEGEGEGGGSLELPTGGFMFPNRIARTDSLDLDHARA